MRLSSPSPIQKKTRQQQREKTTEANAAMLFGLTECRRALGADDRVNGVEYDDDAIKRKPSDDDWKNVFDRSLSPAIGLMPISDEKQRQHPHFAVAKPELIGLMPRRTTRGWRAPEPENDQAREQRVAPPYPPPDVHAQE